MVFRGYGFITVVRSPVFFGEMKMDEKAIGELIVIPLIKDMAERRGIKGVDDDHVKAFLTKAPDSIEAVLKRDPELHKAVIADLGDAGDALVSGVVDALARLFTAVMADSEETENAGNR
jgi:hypothetical protein